MDRYVAAGKLTAVHLTPRTTRITEASLAAFAAGENNPVSDPPIADGLVDESPHSSTNEAGEATPLASPAPSPTVLGA